MDPIITTLIAIAGGAVGIFLKSWIDRKSRGDAVALALLKVKLEFYGEFLPLLNKVQTRMLIRIKERTADGPKLDPNEGFPELSELTDSIMGNIHIISSNVVDETVKFVMHMIAIATEPFSETLQTDLEKRARKLMRVVVLVMREDCGTSLFQDHFRTLAQPDPLDVLKKQWAQHQLEDKSPTALDRKS